MKHPIINVIRPTLNITRKTGDEENTIINKMEQSTLGVKKDFALMS